MNTGTSSGAGAAHSGHAAHATHGAEAAAAGQPTVGSNMMASSGGHGGFEREPDSPTKPKKEGILGRIFHSHGHKADDSTSNERDSYHEPKTHSGSENSLPRHNLEHGESPTQESFGSGGSGHHEHKKHERNKLHKTPPKKVREQWDQYYREHPDAARNSDSMEHSRSSLDSPAQYQQPQHLEHNTAPIAGGMVHQQPQHHEHDIAPVAGGLAHQQQQHYPEHEEYARNDRHGEHHKLEKHENAEKHKHGLFHRSHDKHQDKEVKEVQHSHPQVPAPTTAQPDRHDFSQTAAVGAASGLGAAGVAHHHHKNTVASNQQVEPEQQHNILPAHQQQSLSHNEHHRTAEKVAATGGAAGVAGAAVHHHKQQHSSQEQEYNQHDQHRTSERAAATGGATGLVGPAVHHHNQEQANQQQPYAQHDRYGTAAAVGGTAGLAGLAGHHHNQQRTEEQTSPQHHQVSSASQQMRAPSQNEYAQTEGATAAAGTSIGVASFASHYNHEHHANVPVTTSQEGDLPKVPATDGKFMDLTPGAGMATVRNPLDHPNTLASSSASKQPISTHQAPSESIAAPVAAPISTQPPSSVPFVASSQTESHQQHLNEPLNTSAGGIGTAQTRTVPIFASTTPATHDRTESALLDKPSSDSNALKGNTLADSANPVTAVGTGESLRGYDNPLKKDNLTETTRPNLPTFDSGVNMPGKYPKDV